MRTTFLCSFRLASLLPLAVFLGAAGCGAQAEPGEPAVEEVGTSAAAITASDAIARAEEWVTAKLLYCQSPNGAPDADPACPATCVRQSNPAWDPYRSDCSGLVSWAWGLPAPGRTTAEFAPNQTDITKAIQASTLAMGDAVCTDDATSNDHHIMLFKAWVTPGSEATFIEEPGCSANPDYAHEFSSSVTLSGTQIKVAYNGMTFTAIRYGGLTASATYAASYVSQSWPLSSAPAVKMTAGQTVKGSIDMKNTGTATWTAGVVKLAPIPRDQASPFQAASWLSPTRVSTIAADVAPGGTGHFEWDLDPSQAGSFQPYFGLVAEGVTWFADSGGPPDNDIQVNLDVAPAPATGSSSSSSTGGSASTGSGSGSTSSSTGSGSGSSGTGTGTGSGSGSSSGGAGGAGTGTGNGSSSGNGENPGPQASSGCQMTAGAAPSWMELGLLAGLLVAQGRRRRGARSEARSPA